MSIKDRKYVKFNEGFQDPDGVMDELAKMNEQIASKNKNKFQGYTEKDILNNISSEQNQRSFAKQAINDFKKKILGNKNVDMNTLINNYLTGETKGIKTKYLRKKKRNNKK